VLNLPTSHFANDYKRVNFPVRFFVLSATFFIAILLGSMPIFSYAQEGDQAEQTLNLNPEQAKKNAALATNEQTNTSAQASDKEEGKAGNKDDNNLKEVPAPTPSITLFKQDIENFISKKSVTPMMAGTDDFMTLVEKDLHPTDKGVMILVPEWQQSATSPKAINFLRKHLPTDGWATITIQPLEKPMIYPSRAEKEVERNTENEEAISAYTEQFIPMMAKVFEEAANYPGIFVVVAEGNNAAILIDLFEQQQLPMPNAMVMLSAHQLNEADNQRLALTIAESDLPILDLYLSSDNNWVHHFVKLRQQIARREMKTYFRQRQFKSFSPGYYPEQSLAKSIKGWIASIGW